MRYHDEDWGVPVHDDRRLFEMLSLVRNRAKIAARVANAKAFLAVQDEQGSFDAYVRASSAAGRFATPGDRFATCRQRPRSPLLSAVISEGVDFASSGRRSVAPSCRPLEWSTTTPSTVSTSVMA